MKSLLEVLEISSSSYYKYRNTIDRDYNDYILIKEVFEENKKVYGYRRISDALLEQYGLIMNRKKTARIMRKYGIKAEYLKRNRKKQNNLMTENIKEDLIKRNFNQRGWVTDITYLFLSRNSKKAYLSTILDLQTRNIVAYKISFRNDIKLVIDTLNEAIGKTKDLSRLILHSDQGFQYLSTEYKTICESNRILISMSRKGTPIDNAVIESFHSSLKKETLYNNNIKSLDEYIHLVINWMYFYNTTRLRQTKK